MEYLPVDPDYVPGVWGNVHLTQHQTVKELAEQLAALTEQGFGNCEIGLTHLFTTPDLRLPVRHPSRPPAMEVL